MAAAAAAVVLAFGFVLGLVVVAAGGSQSQASVAPPCITTGPIHGLTSIAAANARTVTSVAESVAGTQGAVIAVMVGYTESGLRVLGNLTIGINGLPTQGWGSDHDSVGIFQQRASWGTVAQRLDPQTSTRLFLARLVKLKGWQVLAPWIAAQRVQVSAYDGAPRAANHYSSTYGGNYKVNFGLAERVVAQIDRDAAVAPCGALAGGLPANAAPGSHGLPADYVVPADATSTEAQVIRFAIAQLDKPYVFGAGGPNAYDCSGLTLAAWQQVGVTLAHDTVLQATEGTATSVGELRPGDLVLVPGDDGTLAAPGHVGLYIGDGLVLNAADEHDGIRVQTYANFVHVGHGLSALRHIE